MTKLFTESPNAYQMRSTPCATYQNYFGRNGCLMVACQYFHICIWWEYCNAVMSIYRSMEGVKKHPRICLFLSTMKIHSVCCGHSTLKGIKFGTSVPVSDVQYTVSNLLSISLVGWPFMDKKVQQTLFIATSGHKLFPLPWAPLLRASWPLLPLLSLSMFIVEISGYWSPAKSTFAASPACNKILLNTISAKSENLSGILLIICSIAIASMMTANVWAGRCWRLSTPSSRSLGRAALLVFAKDPSNEASDQGRGPSSCTNNSHKSTFRLWPITSNRAKRFLSALKMTVFPSLDNDDDFLTLLKLPSFNLESVSKKPLEVDNNLSSTKVVRASVPFFFAVSKSCPLISRATHVHPELRLTSLSDSSNGSHYFKHGCVEKNWFVTWSYFTRNHCHGNTKAR